VKEYNSPRVFISYSWDSLEHRRWVRFLAERLRINGIDARLDQWHIKAGESFTRFMEEEVTASDFVIAVCTPAFARKSNTRQGGAGYEQQIVSGLLVSGSPRSKFIPIIRSGEYEPGPDCAIPTHFTGIAAIDFRHHAEFQERLEDLLRVIFDRPRFAPPPLGTRPALPTIQDTVTLPRSNVLEQNDDTQDDVTQKKINNEPDKTRGRQRLIFRKANGDLNVAEFSPRWLKHKPLLVCVAVVITFMPIVMSYFYNRLGTVPSPRAVKPEGTTPSIARNITPNNPPIIKEIRLEKLEVSVGEPVRLFAAVEDPDGDELHYQWRSSIGSIEGNEFNVILNTNSIQLEKNPAFGKVMLTVRDGRGGEATSEVIISLFPKVHETAPTAEIIIGDTDSSADAEATINYLLASTTQPLVDYVINRDGKVFPLPVIASGRRVEKDNIIHIRLAHEIGKEDYTQEQLSGLINLLVDKISENSLLGVDKIHTQQEVDRLHHTDLTRGIRGIRETVRSTISVFSALGKAP
jgi:hypothetical protein